MEGDREREYTLISCRHEHPSVWVCFIFVAKSRGITLPYQMVEPGDPSDTGFVPCPTNGQLVSYAMGLSLSLCHCLCEMFYGLTDGDKGGTNQHAPFLTQLNYLFDLFVDPPAVYIVMLKFCGRWCNVC